MPHNNYVLGGVGSGAWTNLVVPHGVMELLDARQFQSINGDLGGVWAPSSSAITIGGLGLRTDTTSGNFLVTGSGSANFFSSAIVLNATGANFFSGAFAVDATSVSFSLSGSVDFGALTNVTFQNGLDVVSGDLSVDAGRVGITAGNLVLAAGNVVLTAGDLTVGGAADVGSLVVSGTSAHIGLMTAAAIQCTSLLAGSAVTLDATHLTTTSAVTTTLAGPVSLSNSVSLSGTVTPSGTGHVRKRPAVLLSSSGETISIANGDDFIVPALISPQNFPLTTTGATDGDEVTITSFNVSIVAHILNDVSSLIIDMQATTGSVRACHFKMVSGSWLPFLRDVTP